MVIIMRKTTLAKATALTLCAAIAISGTVITSFAINSGEDKAAEESPEPVTSVTDENEGVSKDEMVYVLANADGSVQKVIVSDWIKNSLKAAELTDSTELENIENVNGDESYTAGGDDSRVWDAQGNDIYYQGDIQKELPVDLSVTYKLDGQSVSPAELIGKSGRVTIRFDYTNKQYEMTEIDGSEEKIYVPFAMLTGVLMDNDVFTNVEVTNGKLINDGSRTAVIGIAFPGLQEDLAISKDKLDIPDYVEITADAENFELGMTVTLAANGLFSELDTGRLDTVDDLKGSMGELTGGMSQLIDGSSELYDGLSVLLEKSGELTAGIDKLAEGAAELKAGAGDLDNGAAALLDGAEQLSDGLDTIAANNDTLNGGAKQVFMTLLSTAQSQLTASGLDVPELTIDNYDKVLDGVIASLDKDAVYKKALDTVTSAVEEKRDYIRQQVTEAVKAEVTKKVTDAVQEQVTEKVNAAVKEQVSAKVAETVKQQVTEKVTEAVKEQVTAQVTAVVHDTVEEQVIMAALGMDKQKYDAAVAAGLIDDATKAKLAAAVEQQMATEQIADKIQQNVSAQMSSSDIAKTISEQTGAQMKTAEITKTINDNITAQLASQSIKKTISDNIKQQMASSDIAKTISDNTTAQMKTDTVKKTIEENTEAQVQKAITDNMASDEVKAQLAAASEGVKSVAALKTSLDSYNTFYNGLGDYTAGVAQAADGAKELKAGAGDLKDGSAQLYAGTEELYNGILTLKDGVPALIDGITQLHDGAMQLSDGLNDFREQGIQKLVDLVDNDLDGIASRLRAVIKVSKDYRSFAGAADNMDGQVKFIYRTDSVE